MHADYRHTEQNTQWRFPTPSASDFLLHLAAVYCRRVQKRNGKSFIWQDTGSTINNTGNRCNLSGYNLNLVPGNINSVCFSLFFFTGEGLDSVTINSDTWHFCRRQQEKDGRYCSVTRFPARLCGRDGKLCYYRRLEYDFLAFFALLPSFLVSYPSLSRYFSLLRVASSVQQSSAALQRVFIRVLLGSFVFCLVSELYFLGWRVCCALVPGTSAFDLPTLINSRFFLGFLSHSLLPQTLYLYY